MAFPKPIDGSKLPLDTKGDLIVFGKKNERLPVGTNGQVLTADSSQTLGMKWADLPESGSGTPSGDGTEDTNPETLTESGGAFTKSISFIEAKASFWLASVKYYVGSTAGDITVNLRNASGSLLATKTMSTTGTAWNTFTFSNPVYVSARDYIVIDVDLPSQKLWRKTSTLYDGTLWKMITHRLNNYFTGTNYSETPGLGLVEYDDTP